ncbi:MAG: phage Gp37/Gp68 family protein [Acidobacteria bacterium]|nr:phage Gp37/Gp68 family protein [Acidobacteriota bacterium]
MAQKSTIEWTEATWNPVTGCSKISPGCAHCYAERMANRLKAMGVSRYRNGFEVTLQPDILNLPLRWKTPRLIFVNSMSDLFHEDVPDAYICEAFSVMKEASWHTFQILTKRAKRLARLASRLKWPTNIWMGVSVESPKFVWRIEELKTVPAAVRFLSLEPLLAPFLSLPLVGIDWVIVGGESGPGCRPIEAGWVRNIRTQCLRARVPFFFKQWGGTRKSRAGRQLDGKVWNELPVLENTPRCNTVSAD